MFCKSLNSARARLARVSARLGLFFFLGIKNQKSRLGIKISASFTSLPGSDTSLVLPPNLVIGNNIYEWVCMNSTNIVL